MGISTLKDTLSDAVIFITGAGKGIGEAVVLQLLEQKARFPGLKLFLTSRTESDLKQLSDAAVAAGVPCEFLASDLGTDPLLAFKACLKTYGRIDACVHSAGVGRFGNFLDLTAEDLSFVMKTNVEASFLLMQAVYRHMSTLPLTPGRPRGQIQWVTSVAAERPFDHSSIYCMSKYAQRGLIEVMRSYAYRDHVRILDVKPGATYTPMWGEVAPEQKSKMMDARDIAIPMVDALLLGGKATLESLTLRPLGGDL
jgi:sepiapterin reductase